MPLQRGERDKANGTGPGVVACYPVSVNSSVRALCPSVVGVTTLNAIGFFCTFLTEIMLTEGFGICSLCRRFQKHVRYLFVGRADLLNAGTSFGSLTF